jgi:hypothetical protein
MLERLGSEKCNVYSKRRLPCHSSTHATGRENAERQSKQKKKTTTWAVLCLCSFHHVLQSWINHEIHDWLMIGFCIVMIVRLGLINFARGGTVFATSWF